MSDPAKYRSKEEVQKVRREHDSIEMVRSRILERGILTEDGIKEIDREIRQIVNAAADFAQSEPEPIAHCACAPLPFRPWPARSCEDPSRRWFGAKPKVHV